MLQDIQPHVYHSAFAAVPPRPEDVILVQDGRRLLMHASEAADRSSEASAGKPSGAAVDHPSEASAGKPSGTAVDQPSEASAGKPSGAAVRTELSLPTVGEIAALSPQAAESAFYLFSIDEERYYCTLENVPEAGDLAYRSVMELRELEQDWHAFGGAVAWQLASWYDLHRFCGRCGTQTKHSETERAIICPSCGHIYYPRISPVVIIAILDGDRILLTRYNRSGYRRHALVAGFVEIGETLEDAVRREVMEEVGLKVKNIRYCESQPWPFSSSLIAGFYADVDGDPTVRLNTDGQEELAEGVWFDRKDLVIEDSSVSLTWDMIRRFKEGREVPAQ